MLGNTHILHCQTLSVIPLPLVTASTCFHTFQDSIIRSVDKPVQARILLLATSIPYSKCWYTTGWALCKLCMAFKQILADLTQETANYGSFFGYSLEMKIPVAKSFGLYQLAHNLYHVDVLCPKAESSLPRLGTESSDTRLAHPTRHHK